MAHAASRLESSRAGICVKKLKKKKEKWQQGALDKESMLRDNGSRKERRQPAAAAASELWEHPNLSPLIPYSILVF